MAVFSIWESRFPSDVAAAGRSVTEAIWRDMLSYEGYLRHTIVEDLDDPGHLIVISEWTSRDAADRVREEYAGHENARRADELVAGPRRRMVGRELEAEEPPPRM
jgi:quinol monooxygenase YgiN